MVSLPATNTEFYKSTNVAKYIAELGLDGTSVPFGLDAYLDEAIPTLIFIDGNLQFPDLKIPGLESTLLTSALPAAPLDNAFSAYHRGHLKDGISLLVKKNTQLKAPIRILNIFTRADSFAPVVNLRAEENTSITLIEENVGVTESYAQIGETSVSVASGAKVEHIQIERASELAVHHGSTSAVVDRDGSYRNVILHLQGKVNRRNLDLNLRGTGAHGESFNLYLTAGQEHSDISTVINHTVADTTSKQLAKGILDGSSKGVFTGKIFIHQDAQRVVSGQLNKNLILSNKAQAHSQPQLEIFADDVKCSHGSTTGQLSGDELFYFQARGIPADKARTLLAHGFGLEVVMKIENPAAASHVSSLVLELLKTKFQLEGAL